eukprot:TRINITY_DN6077_c1_g1_i2.p1 TRINITY_DN6077_c1_g1~~TRINITY_DN6077_c1_g1_i2.p1  ORF type:complete len:522 (+),score=37.95 TRINITY_DN6077_c1_g1_i2:117-1682(+)
MTCPVCLDLYVYPVSLRCGHNVCKGCALSVSSAAGVRNGVRTVCPMCREVSEYSAECDLRVNQPLMDAVLTMKGDAVAAHPVCARCEGCRSEVFCADCATPLCRACCEIIHVGKLQEHAVGALPAHGTMASAPRCEHRGHRSYRKELYCSDCSVALCILCSQQHRGHRLLSLAEAGEIDSAHLRSCIERADERRRQLRAACSVADQNSSAVESATAEELLVFERAAAHLKERLSEKIDSLVREAKQGSARESDRVRSHRGAAVKSVARLNEATAAAERALKRADAFDVIACCREIEENLVRVPVPPPCQFSLPQISFGRYQQLVDCIDSISLSFVPAVQRSAPELSYAQPPPPRVLSVSDVNVSPSPMRGGGVSMPRSGTAPPSTAKQLQWGRSTYGHTGASGIYIRGDACECTCGDWETVVTSTRLAGGVCEWEVLLEKFDARGVIVGIVLGTAPSIGHSSEQRSTPPPAAKSSARTLTPLAYLPAPARCAPRGSTGSRSDRPVLRGTCWGSGWTWMLVR